jgi:glycosyltransferase involved in cell wall biosynthesis
MRPLCIALTADPYLPVPPRLYGGIERMIDLLARGLTRRGHRVVLFAHPESRNPGGELELVPYGRPPHRGAYRRSAELWQVGAGLLRRRRRLDVIHSFGRLAALAPVLPLRRLPKLQSYQRAVPWRSVTAALRAGRGSLVFTACSASLLAGRDPAPWRVVFNGVDLDLYRFSPAVPADAPLVFLGRLEPVKGAHTAIVIARAAGRRLVLAGNRVETGGAAGYFEREIAPHLDGDKVRWAGPVDDAAKNELLGAAAALLMPIAWEEPFGIVMAEALACGTPVIGFRRGSVPEVVRDGLNGFVCDTAEEAAAAVAQLGGIDRREVRRDCEARFGAEAIVDQYERIYREEVAAAHATGAAARRGGDR